MSINSERPFDSHSTLFFLHLFALLCSTALQAKIIQTEFAFGNIYKSAHTNHLPTITTTPTTKVDGTSIITGGNITSDGGRDVSQRGVCFGTNPSPTTANETITSGRGMGSFAIHLSGLAAHTTYYVRAFAINRAGTAYGDEVKVTTSGIGEIVTNPGAGITFDGYSYSSIVLGNGQEWMTENLKTSVFANGEPIPNVIDDEAWRGMTTGAWCHFTNDDRNEKSYGKLYNFYAVADSRNVCPTGWHVPTNVEWRILTDYLGDELVAGGKLKSMDTLLWANPNTYATNESGFSGLPGGDRDDNGQYDGILYFGYWWSATAVDSTHAYGRRMFSLSGGIEMYSYKKGFGFSVRCLKD